MKENGSCKLVLNPGSGWDWTQPLLRPHRAEPVNVPVTQRVSCWLFRARSRGHSSGARRAAVGRGQLSLAVSGLSPAGLGRGAGMAAWTREGRAGPQRFLGCRTHGAWWQSPRRETGEQ